MLDENTEVVALLRELIELEKQKARQNARSSRFFLIAIVVFFVALAVSENYFQKKIYEHYAITVPSISQPCTARK